MNLSEVFLGIIALATLAMAVLQIGAALAVSRLARDAQKTFTSVQDDVKPLIAKVSALADEANEDGEPRQGAGREDRRAGDRR